MEITLNVKKNGELTGSCGWVSKKLENAEVCIEGNYIKAKYLSGKNKEGKEVYKTKYICGVIDADDWGQFARTTNDGKYWFAYPYDEDLGCGYDKYTLFDTVLTDAAWSIADDFIKKCLKCFREEWEKDKED